MAKTLQPTGSPPNTSRSASAQPTATVKEGRDKPLLPVTARYLKSNLPSGARGKATLQTVEDDFDAAQQLLLQAYETELGGVEVYTAAIRLARNPQLKKEWQEYLEQTRNHVEILRGVFAAWGLDTQTETSGRQMVRCIGEGLVGAMEIGARGDLGGAQIVAAECVVLAETKDHLNWELLGALGKSLTGPRAKALTQAAEEIEDQEDEHLYHTTGWCRELWLEALGMPAVLPPPEEAKDVRTAMGAARAKQNRKQLLPKGKKA